ncbi:MAG: di-trans,poly-cis-decaprenylcistransferase [SAR202 cluster bacterium]|nr:di-trans,poly-cis-decaprenylcistransferase [SAR202 cluster bacterium]
MQVRTDSASSPAPRKPQVPRHVAIIMDGNGRWARKRGLPRLAGHKVGVERIQKVLETLGPRGVEYVTLFAFSTENWNRPSEEVQGIMALLHEALERQTKSLHEKNVRVVHLGKVDRLSPDLREGVAHAQRLTIHNTGITLNVAFDYGGRDEILEAVRRIIREGVLPEVVDEALFSRYLYTAHSPDPDLIIRTGGELRISNFLLWQSAYSEYYHTPTLWPDLDAAELERALEAFGRRQRRFGTVAKEE